ncbi:MAG TPA: hypothetical protein VNC15_05120, partial [Solirubrobacterales bacterium]|nr:hypothetical protein [Solirubrobacterales bacterium]
MSKKMMLLALAVASAALFALPAFASASELHTDTATSFTGTGGPGSLKAKGEPTITCESADVNNGTISAGGTTGTMTLDFTGCHASVFGFTAKCHTTGSALDNTIASGGTFHLITFPVEKPAVLVTANPTEITCAGISTTYVEGNIIGTITSPNCNTSSNTMTLSFTATVNGSGDVTQDHELYTGNFYDLVARTGGKTG